MMSKMIEEWSHEDITKVWKGIESIILTEDKKKEDGETFLVKKVVFKIIDYDTLKWILESRCKNVDWEIDSMERSMDISEVEDPEEIEHLQEKIKEGFSFTMDYSTYIVDPIAVTITYFGYSFHHFFQHMFDWFPRDLDGLLHSGTNRRLRLGYFHDGDETIPVSRGMVSYGFMHPQKAIDDEYQNSITKFIHKMALDEQQWAIEAPEEPDDE